MNRTLNSRHCWFCRDVLYTTAKGVTEHERTYHAADVATGGRSCQFPHVFRRHPTESEAKQQLLERAARGEEMSWDSPVYGIREPREITAWVPYRFAAVVRPTDSLEDLSELMKLICDWCQREGVAVRYAHQMPVRVEYVSANGTATKRQWTLPILAFDGAQDLAHTQAVFAEVY